MIEEVINEIKDAERRAEQIINEAQIKASEIISEANNFTEDLKEKSQAAIKERRSFYLNSALEEARIESEKIYKAAGLNAQKIKHDAKPKIDEAAEKVKNYVLDNRRNV